MKKLLITATLILISLLPAAAQKRSNHNDPNRAHWTKEMQLAKIEYITKAISLDADKRDQFTNLYRSMENELESQRHDLRALTDKIDSSKDVSELEYENAAQTLFESKGKENEIEMRYYKKFKELLSKEQLYKMKKAELKWMRELMKHRKNKKQ